jgi:hypothetical protein
MPGHSALTQLAEDSCCRRFYPTDVTPHAARCCLQVSDTVDIDACRVSYYTNLFPLNPGGIIPSGPTAADLGLNQPAGRGSTKLQDVCYMQAAAAVQAVA